MITIGLISDTHGLLRPEVLERLQGVDAIIHAGDICDRVTVPALNRIAPTYPVAGNMDAGNRYPVSDLIEIAGLSIYIIHDIEKLDIDLDAAGIDILIFGHTHRPARFTQSNTLCINPGSAGPPRLNRPVSMAKIRLERQKITTEFLTLF